MEVKMKIEPKGNWIWVTQPFVEKEEESLIALPEDWKPAEKPYKAISVQKDPEGEYNYGDIIVVPTHIIREIEIRKNKFYLVERSHVLAEVLPE